MSIDLIGGKWKVLILWNLYQSTLRFNELNRLFPDLSTKMLTQQLRTMEEDGLIQRTVYPQVPPKVEYSLTEFGISLIPVLKSMQEWGSAYVDKQNNKPID